MDIVQLACCGVYPCWADSRQARSHGGMSKRVLQEVSPRIHTFGITKPLVGDGGLASQDFLGSTALCCENSDLYTRSDELLQ